MEVLNRYFEKNPAKIFLAISILINLEFLMGPYGFISMNPDIFSNWMVFMKTSAERLLKYGIHSWDPSVICGNILITHSHATMPLNPIYNLAGIAPLWVVYYLYMITAYFVASYGMYLYLLRIQNLTKIASFAGGILFLGFTAIQINPLTAVFSFSFPLYLYCYHQYFDTGKYKYILTILLLFICSFVAYTLPYFPIIHFIMILGLVHPIHKMKKYLVGLFIIWVAYVLIHSSSIYVLIREAPNFHRIARTAVEAKSILDAVFISLNEIPGLAIIGSPHFFLNTLPYSLSIITIFYLRKKEIKFFWMMAFAIYLFEIFCRSSLYTSIQSHFGLFEHFYFFRFDYIFPFIITVCTAFGIYILENIKKKDGNEVTRLLSVKPDTLLKFIFPVIIGIIAFTAFPVSLKSYKLSIVIFYVPALITLVYVIYAFKIWREKQKINPIAILMLIIIVLITIKFSFITGGGIIQRGRNFNYYFDRQAFENINKEKEKIIFRVVMAGFYDYGHSDNTAHASYLQYHGLQTADGIISNYPVRYRYIWSKIIEPVIEDSKLKKWADNFLSWGNYVYLFSSPPIEDTDGKVPYFEKVEFNTDLLALLNVKYVLFPYPLKNPEKYGMQLYSFPSRENIFVKISGRYDAVKHKLELLNISSIEELMVSFKNHFFPPMNSYFPYWIYSLNSFVPRTFVVSNWDTFDTREELISALSSMRASDFTQKVVFLKNDISGQELPSPSINLKWSSEIIIYEPEYIKIKNYSNNEGIMVLIDNFHKNWKAFINGKEVTIFPAYYAFRGIVVPKGEAVVEFKYKDGLLNIMYLLSLAGIIILILSNRIVGHKYDI